MTTTHDWADAANVLAIRLDSLGDVLMTGPALRALKQSRPDRRLTLLTSAAGAAAAALLPDVDEVLVHEVPWMKATPARADCRPEFDLLQRLRRRRFDAAVIFTVYSQSPQPAALLCHLADIPRRLAYCRENPYQLLSPWIPEREPDNLVRHEVRRQLDLVAEVGCAIEDERLHLRVPDEDRRWAIQALQELDMPRGYGDDGRLERWVLIHPGASAASRRYPAEGFAAVALTLAVEHGCRVLFTGSEKERSAVEQVQTAMNVPSVSLAGRMSLGRLAAVISLAPVVVTNNTGPAHIAAAVGTPVVDLYALTNPQHTPWAVLSRVLFHDVPCKFCYRSVCPELHHDCLRKVTPEAVVSATLEIARWRGKAMTSSLVPGVSWMGQEGRHPQPDRPPGPA